MGLLEDVFGTTLPVFGMIHLAPLPGSPRFDGSMKAVLERAEADASALKTAGVDALIVENFNDEPFFKETTDPETIAAIAIASKLVSETTGLPLGINILRNSWRAAIGVSACVDARFMRINVLTDAVVTDQGIIEGCSARLTRVRRSLLAEKVLIFADIESKHASPLVRRPRWAVAQDMIERGGADAIIVSGETSAEPPSVEHMKDIRSAVPKAPLIIGSGMSLETVDLLKYADATIFGFGAKKELKAPVDSQMAEDFMAEVMKLRHSR